MKRCCFLFLLVLILQAACLSAAAETRPLDAFMKDAAGRYVTVRGNDTIVLELVPAFGRLFGAVGYYTEGFLYSYYAADLTPACGYVDGDCPYEYTSRSIDFLIQMHSNLSNAGNYWEGLTQQRLTLVSDALLLSNFAGNGEGLISKEMLLMVRNDKAPSLFPYSAEMAAMGTENTPVKVTPDLLNGPFTASWSEAGRNITQMLSFEENGEISLLRDCGDDMPPRLFKGGFVLTEQDEETRELCILTSSPSSGTMPSGGCFLLRNTGSALLFEKTDEWDDLLTGPGAQRVYKLF